MVSASWSGRIKIYATAQNSTKMHARMLSCPISHILQRAITGIR